MSNLSRNHLEWIGPMANGLMDLRSSFGKVFVAWFGIYHCCWYISPLIVVYFLDKDRSSFRAMAASKKCAKFLEPASTLIFNPLAFETLVPVVRPSRTVIPPTAIVRHYSMLQCNLFLGIVCWFPSIISCVDNRFRNLIFKFLSSGCLHVFRMMLSNLNLAWNLMSIYKKGRCPLNYFSTHLCKYHYFCFSCARKTYLYVIKCRQK